ncbi:MAG: hypothetical protein N3A38_11635, partial [Planctomycetota bacterium]|nr:hypothetical protein [Planctomycetota bacterium]
AIPRATDCEGGEGDAGSEGKIEELIKDLGANEAGRRDAAEEALAGIGAPALPLLEKARASSDRETAKRAGRLYDRIRVRPFAPKRSFAGALEAKSVAAFVELPDPAAMRDRFRKTALYRIWSEESFRNFHRARMDKEIPRRRKYAGALASLTESLSGPQAWLLADRTLRGGDEWVVPHAFFLQSASDAPRFRVAVSDWFACMDEEPEKREEMEELPVETLFDSYRILSDEFLAWAMSKPLMEKITGWLKRPPEAAASLAGDPAYRKAIELAGGGADAVAFLTREGLSQILVDPDPDSDMRKLASKLLAEGFLNAAAALRIGDDGTISERCRIETDGVGGIWSALGSTEAAPAADDAPLRAVPAQASMAIEVRADVGKIHGRFVALARQALGGERFDGMVEEFREKADEWGFTIWDLAAAAKGPAIVAVFPRVVRKDGAGGGRPGAGAAGGGAGRDAAEGEEDAEEGPPLGIMIAAAVHDPKAVLTALEKRALGEDAILKRKEMTGCLVYINEDDEEAPALLVKGNIFVFLSRPWMAGAVAGALAGKALRLMDSDDYKAWRSALPPGTVAAAYLAPGTFAAQVYKPLREEFGLGPRGRIFPAEDAIRKHLAGRGSAILTRSGNVFEADTKSPLPLEIAAWIVYYLNFEAW